MLSWNQHYFNFIDKHSIKPWNWGWLSKNRNVTWEIVEANPVKPWNWRWLSGNPTITWEIVEANPDKPWSWDDLSHNSNITFEIIESNIDKPWNWNALSINLFETEKQSCERICKHQKFVQENLFEEFVKSYMHPKRMNKLLDMGYTIDEIVDEVY